MDRKCVTLLVASLLFTGCAELNKFAALVRAPQFEQAPDHRPEIRMSGPASGLPARGAGVRLWARVTNPNPFSLTLGMLKGRLFLQDARAADVDFPLGLPLAAGGETTVPIDLTVNFANLPGLADSIRRAVNQQPLAYRLEGTVGVDAGRLGQPVFGPMTLLSGDVRPIAGP
jgi:late embryogenesis abundant protein